jgi:hypothetical protein
LRVRGVEEEKRGWGEEEILISTGGIIKRGME